MNISKEFQTAKNFNSAKGNLLIYFNFKANNKNYVLWLTNLTLQGIWK